MAYRDLGPPNGEPWLVLHGGPGSGAQPGLVQAFALDRQRVVVPDQRGSGLSHPRGRTAGNHTDQLVADLERLRQQLGIKQWSLLAGSWGTVLALNYAQKHPQRVARVVLRGAFKLRWAEIGGLLQMRSSGPRGLAQLEHLLQVGTHPVATLHAIRWWNLLELNAVLHGMWRSLIHATASPDQASTVAIRRDWVQIKRQQRKATARFKRPGISHADRRGWQKFRIQSHYLRHLGFQKPGDLDRAVRDLASHGIPSDWVHGRFDAVCPTSNSQNWLAKTQALNTSLARGHWPIGGHLATEPGLRSVLEKVIHDRPLRP